MIVTNTNCNQHYLPCMYQPSFQGHIKVAPSQFFWSNQFLGCVIHSEEAQTKNGSPCSTGVNLHDHNLDQDDTLSFFLDPFLG